MFAKFKLILAGIVTVLGVMAAMFMKGRSSGMVKIEKEVQAQHNEDVATVATERVESVKVVNNVQKEVISASDSNVDAELSDKWTRG